MGGSDFVDLCSDALPLVGCYDYDDADDGDDDEHYHCSNY